MEDTPGKSKSYTSNMVGYLHRRFQSRNVDHCSGDVVRINPYEIHVNNPEYFHMIYSNSSRKTDKWEWSAKMFG
jgi:hypothetical protein